MSEWIQTNGKDPGLDPSDYVELRYVDMDATTTAPLFGFSDWGRVTAYRMIGKAEYVRCPKCYKVHHRDNVDCDGLRPTSPPQLNGGKLKGDHYYRVRVDDPIAPDVAPYTAECADIIEALGMTFNEGEAFKAIWRLAAARQGRGKPGNQPQYDADKVAHYGARIVVQTKRGA